LPNQVCVLVSHFFLFLGFYERIQQTHYPVIVIYLPTRTALAVITVRLDSIVLTCSPFEWPQQIDQPENVRMDTHLSFRLGMTSRNEIRKHRQHKKVLVKSSLKFFDFNAI